MLIEITRGEGWYWGWEGVICPVLGMDGDNYIILQGVDPNDIDVVKPEHCRVLQEIGRKKDRFSVIDGGGSSKNDGCSRIAKDMRKASMDIASNGMSLDEIKEKYGHILKFLDELGV